MTSSAKMYVLVGEKSACIRIQGRANFNSSVDFKTLMAELRQRGYGHFVLDLSECLLMDSTFLGVLAGFGLKLQPKPGETGAGRGIELFRPSARVLELLEGLGVMHLFRVTQDAAAVCGEAQAAPTREAEKLELTETCIEAHRTLVEIDPRNAAKFKEVTAFLAEDLKRLRGGGAG